MQLRATAFLKRSIRQDSRLVSHHGMRAAMAIMILYLFFIEFEMSAAKAAVGGLFAGSVITCCYWFLTLVGGVHFSCAIVEEKEEQTLALLRMTGASPFTILAGKSIPRLAVAVLSLFVVAPFLMLSITLGGVLPMGLAAAILSILCYAVMLCQVGLFASVVSNTAPRAFSLTCVLWLALELPHWWAGLAGATVETIFGHGAATFASLCDELALWLSQRSLVSNLSSTLLSFDPSEIWHPHMTYHLCIAVVFFALSWVLFEPLTSREVSSGESAPVKKELRGPQLMTSRIWNNAPMWKSWQHVSGGRLWFLFRLVGAPVIIFGISVVLSLASNSHVSFAEVFGWSLFFGICFFLINLARLLGRVFNEEIHQKTLASLIMLPQKNSSVFWSMIGGLMPAIVAAAICGVLSAAGLTAIAIGEGLDLEDMAEFLTQPWVWHFFFWVLVTAHVGLLLTTYVKHGGMLMAVALFWIVAPLFFGVTTALFAFRGGGGGIEELFQYVVPLILIVIECVVCVVMQKLILRRLQDLAAR